MVIIGVLVRVEAVSAAVVQRRLAAMAGVTPFSLDDSTQMGLLIEAATLDDGYHLLRHGIEDIEGVAAACPVYVHFRAEDVEERLGQPAGHSLAV
jgi:nitrate reductase NapAB chaperone NapD